jgi:formate dehydrogenase major subunit
VINYAIENNRIAKEYLIHFTNAAFVIEGNFRLPADADGVFSGFDAEKHSYNRASWNYSGGQPASAAAGHSATPAPLTLLPEKVDYDLTLQNPNCVFQLLKKHYSRYTPEMVERITGISFGQKTRRARCPTHEPHCKHRFMINQAR